MLGRYLDGCLPHSTDNNSVINKLFVARAFFLVTIVAMEPVDVPDSGSNDTTMSISFTNALRVLLGVQYETEHAATAALQGFMLKAPSNLHKHPTWRPANNSGQNTTPYVCADRQCKFRLLLRYGGTKNPIYTFAVGEQSPPEHQGHIPTAPVRATDYATKVVTNLIEEEKRQGAQGLDLVTSVVHGASKQGIATTSRMVNDIRRGMEKKKLQARVFEGKNMTYMLQLGEQMVSVDADGMNGSDLDAAAVIGMLRHLQMQQKDAYIRGIIVDGVLQYAYWSTMTMRMLGSRFGSTRLFDDKHNVSNKGYHLASCTVQTNNGCRVVGRAIMASSSGENWTQFMQDNKDAFATPHGGPACAFRYGIADGDGEIDSALHKVEREVILWPCWFHWDKRTNELYRQLKSEWGPIHELLLKLMETSRKDESDLLMKEAKTKIDALSNEALRTREQIMFDDICTSRLPHNLLAFTNLWTSQSATESQNAVLERLKVGPQFDLSVILDRVMKYDTKKDAETESVSRNVLQPVQKKLFGAIQVIVTKECFSRLAREYDLATRLTVTEPSVGRYLVTVPTKETPRIVSKDPTTGHYICECNMAIYEGITCRHTQRVLILNGETLDESHIDTRWKRTSRQTPVVLKNRSPFKDITANDIIQNEQREDDICSSDGGKGKEELDGSEKNIPPTTADLGDYTSAAQRDMELQIEGSEEVIVHVGGYTVAQATLRPTEMRNQVRETAWSTIRRCGTDRSLLSSFEAHIQAWRDANVPDTPSGIVTLASGIGPTVGQPGNPLKLKQPGRVMRTTSKKVKVAYKCGNCGVTGHNKSKCRKRVAESEPAKQPSQSADSSNTTGKRQRQVTKKAKEARGK